jgi:hypothetical protein
MKHAIIVAFIAAVSSAGSTAGPLDPCSLLSSTDKIELGLPADLGGTHEDQPGGVQACKYQTPDSPVSTRTASIILSSAAQDRVFQFRALLAKAVAENTQAQLETRGEYYAGGVMCKVVLAAQRETSQCMGATEKSIVALALSRPNAESKVAHPAAQLRLTATLVSRVAARGRP